MSMLKPADIVRKVSTVSSLPAVYQRINAAVNNPQSSLSDVSAIIREDVGLTTRLLKLVNSVFFGFPSKIDSISAACVIVGTTQLRSLALATSVVGLFRDRQVNGLDINRFWEHSIGCAMASSAIARQAGDRDAERFFVCGLLHDVGRLIMLQELKDEAYEAVEQARREQRSLPDVEQEIFGFTHADVGGELLSIWKLPPSLTEVIRYHHQPMKCIGYPVESATTHFGDVVAHALGLGFSGSDLVPAVQPVVLDRLRLTPERLQFVAEDVSSQFEEMVAMILG